jgi:hypothetical protein
MAMSARGLSADQRRAFRLLAGSPHGCTEAILLAHGFTTEMLTVLVRDGFPLRLDILGMSRISSAPGLIVSPN